MRAYSYRPGEKGGSNPSHTHTFYQVEDVMRRKEVKVFFGKGFKKGKKKAIEYASESTYRRGKIIWSSMDADDKGMMVMEVLRKHIVVDRPMVVGFTVLELRQERFLELYSTNIYLLVPFLQQVVDVQRAL